MGYEPNEIMGIKNWLMGFIQYKEKIEKTISNTNFYDLGYNLPVLIYNIVAYDYKRIISLCNDVSKIPPYTFLYQNLTHSIGDEEKYENTFWIGAYTERDQNSYVVEKRFFTYVERTTYKPKIYLNFDGIVEKHWKSGSFHKVITTFNKLLKNHMKKRVVTGYKFAKNFGNFLVGKDHIVVYLNTKNKDLYKKFEKELECLGITYRTGFDMYHEAYNYALGKSRQISYSFDQYLSTRVAQILYRNPGRRNVFEIYEAIQKDKEVREILKKLF